MELREFYVILKYLQYQFIFLLQISFMQVKLQILVIYFLNRQEFFSLISDELKNCFKAIKEGRLLGRKPKAWKKKMLSKSKK